jgi:hypothetical protein
VSGENSGQDSGKVGEKREQNEDEVGGEATKIFHFFAIF